MPNVIPIKIINKVTVSSPKHTKSMKQSGVPIIEGVSRQLSLEIAKLETVVSLDQHLRGFSVHRTNGSFNAIWVFRQLLETVISLEKHTQKLQRYDGVIQTSYLNSI
jgi:hypothetical protein